MPHRNTVSLSLAELQQRLTELELENARLVQLSQHQQALIADTVINLRTPLMNLDVRIYLLENGNADFRSEYLAELKDQIAVMKQQVDSLVAHARLDWLGFDNGSAGDNDSR